MAYSQPLHWIIVLKSGWLVMSRFPYNVKSGASECRRNANNKQNPTTNNAASIFLGFWRWIRQYDITKHASTTSHFRNFLMSKSKRDFLSERRNRRSSADVTATTSKINNQQSSFHSFRDSTLNSSIWFNQTCVYDFSLPKFPNVQVKTRFFVRTSKSQIECRRNGNNKQNPTTNNPASIFLRLWR